MNTKSVLYQLFLHRVNKDSVKPICEAVSFRTASFAIALLSCLAIITPRAIAQDNVIELQDADSTGSTSPSGEIDYRSLPPLEGQNAPSPIPGSNTTPIPAESVQFATDETDYTLGAGDQINLNIFQVEEYSGEYPVLVDGTISLPLVGRVDVRGLSLKETSETVSKKYATYLKRPIITVGLVAPRPLKIGVSGEVDNPGSYQVAITADNPQFPTVTDMLQQAGGINTIADVRNVRVRREIQGKEVVYNSNLWDLLTKGQIQQNISLRDGDTIFVPTADAINPAELNKLATASYGLQTDKPIQVAVVGEVNRPGSHSIQPEQLARNNNGGVNQGREESSPPRLSQAIGAANGIKPLADVRNIQVKRTAWDGSEKIIPVDLWELIESGDTNQDLILQEGDKVVIAKADPGKITKAEQQTIRSGSFNANITVNVVGEVVTPGPVEVQPNTPLNQAILAAGGFDSQRASSKVELVSLQPDGTVNKRKIEVDLGAEVNDETNPVLGNNDVVVVGRSGTTAATDTAGNLLSPLGAFGGFLNLIF